jgi:hypothetical protein
MNTDLHVYDAYPQDVSGQHAADARHATPCERNMHRSRAERTDDELCDVSEWAKLIGLNWIGARQRSIDAPDAER